jgi:hypothetical protein
VIAGILVPGRGYSTQAPLLDLADAAVRARRGHAEHVTWSVPEGLSEIGPEPFVRAHVSAALVRAESGAPGSRPVVIAKSLGSYAAALVGERGIPAIWLTPILTDPEIGAAIAASPAPALLVGGTADRLWVPEAAEATGKAVLTIPDGSHGLHVPGPLRRYTDVLGDVATAVEDFLDAL